MVSHENNVIFLMVHKSVASYVASFCVLLHCPEMNNDITPITRPEAYFRKA